LRGCSDDRLGCAIDRGRSRFASGELKDDELSCGDRVVGGAVVEVYGTGNDCSATF
jgi:hypothetical protein